MNANLMVIQCVLSLYLHQKAPKRLKRLGSLPKYEHKGDKSTYCESKFEKTQTTEIVYIEQLITNACNTHIPMR